MNTLHIKKFGWLILPVVLFISSCSKSSLPPPPANEADWLQQPRGIVVESGGFSCDYFIVQNQWGYSLLRSFGSSPFVGATVYGQHTSWGTYTFYNRSGGYLFNASVEDYGLSYFAALDQMQWYCNDPFSP